MSTGEGDAIIEETTPVVEGEEGETGEPQEKKLDVFEALEQVLKIALIHDGLARGLRESVKALDRHQANLCVLASNCSEPNYVALVRALCDEHEVKLIKVPEAATLGAWVGLSRTDAEGAVRKVVPCSTVVIKDFGEQSEALDVLLEYLKSRGSE